MGSQSSSRDSLGFLQTAEASLRVREHMDLFLWLQGDVQAYLPHEVLIAAWGDFSSMNISFDVISPLPRLRTENLYTLGTRPPSGQQCARRDGTQPKPQHPCGVLPFVAEMRNRWKSVGHAPYAIHRDGTSSIVDFICDGCDQPAAQLLSGMKSCLVHGFSDQRGRVECIYVFLSTQELSDPKYRRSLQFFLPYVDFSLRQVAHLTIQQSDSGGDEAGAGEAPAEGGEQTVLSQREKEIMEWVRIGKTNYEIGMILNISAFTVKNHLQRIFKKFDVTNRAQAVEKINRLAAR